MTRAYGQRPTWCRDTTPEEPMIDTRTGADVVTWARYFGPRGSAWDVGLFSEDHLSGDGLTTTPTVIRVFDPECDLTADEAEAFALAILDAVRVLRGCEQ